MVQASYAVWAAEVLEYNKEGRLLYVNLGLKNPSGAAPVEHIPPEELVQCTVEKERHPLALMEQVQSALEGVGR